MMQKVEARMDPLQFCYWLQGFAELNNGVPPNEMQWKAIRDHLALVFEKKTPPYNIPIPRSPNLQDENYKPEPARVWYQPNTLSPTPPWTITCTSGQPNNQSMSIC